ncbi:MAG: hypothetical protein HeimC3_21030 [Candidatus Heimdallarchaeota archaeon LC_3]|nr:MAG: hypothetical protein HeimC3_21030 [Candidatus Heimdallarchaeota archaeon LC_3]
MNINKLKNEKFESNTLNLLDYFPADIRSDLHSGLKMRTIMTLTEIAYQNPTETNLIEISKILNIPKSTMSDEMKKLIDFGYIEYFITTKVITDARYKTYIITSKGLKLLHMLKNVFQLTINQIKEKDQ